MFFELQAVPQIVTKTREQYEDARDELLREYQAFTRFALSRFDAIDIVFDARPGAPLRVGYNLQIATHAERARFLKYAATLRKYLRFSEAEGPSNRDVRHLRRAVTNVLDRRVDFIPVGGLDERAVTDPRVLPPTAGKPLRYDPQLVAGTVMDTVTFSWMQLLGDAVKVLSGLDRPYLVPTVKRFAHHRGPRHWHHVLSALRHHPDLLRIRCRRRIASSAPQGEVEYALLCLSYFLATMKDKLDPAELNRRAAMFRAVISKQPLYTIDVELAANNDVAFEALGRDTDPDLFERAHSSQLRRLLHSSKHPAALYARLFSLDEACDLLCPPYTFRDALEGVRHFVPKPFHAPNATLRENTRSIVLGRLDDAQNVALALNVLTRHLFITGTTGSGKTNTIKHVIAQLVGMRVPVLIIDPVKRDFECFVRELEGSQVTVLDFSPQYVDQWIRFNPFIPPPRISLYSHSVVLAKTLAMLFPNNPVGFDILLQMIRQVYAWAYQIGSGGVGLDSESFHRLTGEDLQRDPSLAPTFGYFLDVALNVVSGSETIADPPTEPTGPLSQYTLETLEHFKRQFGNLRQSALAQVFSPRQGDEDVLQRCLAATGENSPDTPITLIQLHSWLDDREVNAFCALLFAMLYEQRQSEFGERSVAGGPLPLTHVACIDEAHRIFADTPNNGSDKLISPAREVATLMGHMMAECRALGQGLIVSEQSVGKIHSDALINSATKIVHGVGFGKDKEAVASALALSPVEQAYLSFLQPGEALALVPGVQQPLYVTVPNRDPALQSEAKRVPPTACYVLLAGAVELDVLTKARVMAILGAIVGDARFSNTASLRVIRWPIDGPEPMVVEMTHISDAPLTRAIHHEFDDAFVVIEEDVRAHLYERPLAVLLTADTPAAPVLGASMRALAERVDLEWVACELSDTPLAEQIAEQAALTVDLSGVDASTQQEACECVADTVVQLMTARGSDLGADTHVSQTVVASQVAGSIEDSRFRQDVQNLIDRGQFDAAELLLRSANSTAYTDLRRRLNFQG